MANNPAYVLDSFALLAFVHGEGGTERIQRLLTDAEKGIASVYMCIINLGEVVYIIEREQGLSKAHEVLAAVQKLPIEIIPADNQTVLDAAHIKANHPLSYADAFTVVCAQRMGASILTGDGEFQSVERIINIEWLQ